MTVHVILHLSAMRMFARSLPVCLRTLLPPSTAWTKGSVREVPWRFCLCYCRAKDAKAGFNQISVLGQPLTIVRYSLPIDPCRSSKVEKSRSPLSSVFGTAPKGMGACDWMWTLPQACGSAIGQHLSAAALVQLTPRRKSKLAFAPGLWERRTTLLVGLCEVDPQSPRGDRGRQSQTIGQQWRTSAALSRRSTELGTRRSIVIARTPAEVPLYRAR